MTFTALVRRAVPALAVLALPIVAAAGEPGKVELGFVPFGVSYMSSNGTSATSVQAPGASMVTPDRSLYVQWFATEHFALEPQISGFAFFADDDNITTLGLSLRANYLIDGPDRPSPYLFAGGGLWHMKWYEDGETHPLVGFGIGYRQPIRSIGSIRIEAGYEHIFDSSSDEWDTSEGINSLRLAVGVALRF